MGGEPLAPRPGRNNGKFYFPLSMMLPVMLLLGRLPNQAWAQQYELINGQLQEAVPTATPSLSLSTFPTSSPVTEEYYNEQTWATIRITFIINVIVMFLLLTLYEVGRRSPVLRDIYDRKRQTRPGRTPPKLLKGTEIPSWFRCFGRLLECMFVDGYIEKDYAAFAEQRCAEGRHCREVAQSKHQEGAGGEARVGKSCPEGVRELSPLDSALDTPELDATKRHSNSRKTAGLQAENERAEKSFDSEQLKSEDGNSRSDGMSAEVSINEKEQKARKDSGAERSKSEMTVEAAKAGDDDAGEGSPKTIRSEGDIGSDTIESSHKPSRCRFFWIRLGSTLRRRKKEVPGARSKDVPFYFRWMLYFPLLHPVPIDEADRELLRCAGLDQYAMIRFLRLGFEVTFYPFLFACVTLIPLYATSDYTGQFVQDEDGFFGTTVTNGYFSITINHLESGVDVPKLWAVCVIACLYFIFLLRRIYVEWMIFADLRRDFHANGDPDAVKEDDAESLKQYRNSCLVEYIPYSHRRDRDVFLFYESLFPGQVRRAETVLHSEKLDKLIQQRQHFLELYENTEAKQIYRQMLYEKKTESFERGEKVLCFPKRKPAAPTEPKIRVGGTCCRGEAVLAMPHYLSKIETLNGQIEDEYLSIVRMKEESERQSALGIDAQIPTQVQPDAPKSPDFQLRAPTEDYLHKVFIPPPLEAPPPGNCGNGFVEFSTRSAKQAAMQCNLSGNAGYFETYAAPDPRDLFWENAMIERTATSSIKRLVELSLVVGILFWSALVSLIANIENAIDQSNPQGESNLVTFVGGYLPVLLLTILMSLLPIIFYLLGVKVIRFKRRSEVDKFTMKWNFCYRIANFLAVLISGTLYQALMDFQKDPEDVVNKFANAILSQSQFFMNVVLQTIGTGTMLQLSQLWSVLYWLLVRSICTLDAISERNLQRMQEPKWFIFGRFTPEFVYILMTGIVYSVMVPLIMGCCGLYFYVASKVYTHQALYVFSQRYEGGGKLMVTVTHIVFIVIYVAIIVLGIVLNLKEAHVAGILFAVLMLSASGFYHYRIHQEFIQASRELPLTTARIIDEEYNSLLRETESAHSIVNDKQKGWQRSQASITGRVMNSDTSSVGMGIGQPRLLRNYSGGDDDSDYYLYRQPDLNKATWETKPRPYRSDN